MEFLTISSTLKQFFYDFVPYMWHKDSGDLPIVLCCWSKNEARKTLMWKGSGRKTFGKFALLRKIIFYNYSTSRPQRYTQCISVTTECKQHLCFQETLDGTLRHLFEHLCILDDTIRLIWCRILSDLYSIWYIHFPGYGVNLHGIKCT